MKFTRFLEHKSLDYLNFRLRIKAGGCPKCHSPCALMSHGYLRGYAASGGATVSRGLRFWCSNRYANMGCGASFSVYWDSVIPYCSLRTSQLLDLIRTVAAGPSTHGAWYFSGLAISIGSVYRWTARWLALTFQLRTGLCEVVAPPGRADAQPDPYTLHHLSLAFPAADCAIAAFQSTLQRPITG